jgi:hypothetical protein
MNVAGHPAMVMRNLHVTRRLNPPPQIFLPPAQMGVLEHHFKTVPMVLTGFCQPVKKRRRKPISPEATAMLKR